AQMGLARCVQNRHRIRLDCRGARLLRVAQDEGAGETRSGWRRSATSNLCPARIKSYSTGLFAKRRGPFFCLSPRLRVSAAGFDFSILALLVPHCGSDPGNFLIALIRGAVPCSLSSVYNSRLSLLICEYLA